MPGPKKKPARYWPNGSFNHKGGRPSKKKARPPIDLIRYAARARRSELLVRAAPLLERENGIDPAALSKELRISIDEAIRISHVYRQNKRRVIMDSILRYLSEDPLAAQSVAFFHVTNAFVSQGISISREEFIPAWRAAKRAEGIRKSNEE